MTKEKMGDAQQKVTPEDTAFQQKWLTYSDQPVSDTSRYTIWKKFLGTAPGKLNADNYQEIPTKLWDEDFQIPPIESSSHDKASFSREMDNRQEIEHLDRMHDDVVEQPKPTPAQLRDELSVWNPRNLTLFFIEYLIDSEINIQHILDAGRVPAQKKLDERIIKIIDVFEHILKTLNAVDYYASEPERYDPIWNAHPKLFDIDHESKLFADKVNRLSILLTAKHFELLKLRLAIDHYGLIMPDLDEIIKIGEMNNAQCDAEIKAIQEKHQAEAAAAAEEAEEVKTEDNLRGSLRRSQRVYSGLSEYGNIVASSAASPEPEMKPASPPSPKINPEAQTAATVAKTHDRNKPKPTRKQILTAVGAVLLIAAVVTAAVVVTVVSGGTVALALAVGVAATLASFAIVGGLMTTYQKIAHKRAEIAHRHSEQYSQYRGRKKRSINADLHSQLGGPRNKVDEKSVHENSQADQLNVQTETATSPLLSASPLAQNQETIIASTPNAIRR